MVMILFGRVVWSFLMEIREGSCLICGMGVFGVAGALSLTLRISDWVMDGQG